MAAWVSILPGRNRTPSAASRSKLSFATREAAPPFAIFEGWALTLTDVSGVDWSYSQILRATSMP